MEAGARTRRRGRLGLARRLRAGLVLLLVAWFFSPPAVRGAVPLWLPFLLALALEVEFVVASMRSPAGRRRRRPPPDADDRQRFGDGTVPVWEIVEDEETGAPQWVPVADEALQVEAPPPPSPPPPRRLGRALLEATAVLAAVAALLVLLDRGSWEELDASTRARTEARLSAETGRVAGKAVRVGCDTSGRRVGVVQHADGAAIVGGDRAWLTPRLCFALHRLTADGEVDSFSETARAVAVLAHEAWHLRGERDEALTECYGLQSGVALGRRLGLDEATARRMMRAQLVANQLYDRSAAEYVVPAGCVNRGPLDLAPTLDRFP